mmetsp:Transcript_6908/g.12236  ORF Transcript_6908/g.12236 Transcript_6908/m.12236 type:complete len:224 (+) Transcript_6908:577-1248(+)
MRTLTGRGNVTQVLGDSVSEKESVFLGAMAYPVANKREADAAVSSLKSLKEFQGATHRIVAYRAENGDEYMDDDGEAKAGVRLRGVLRKEKVVGGVFVVARWYGGVNIGKARFTHICNCARLLLAHVKHEPGTKLRDLKWGHMKGHQLCELSSSSSPAKDRRTLLFEAATKRRLVASEQGDLSLKRKRDETPSQGKPEKGTPEKVKRSGSHDVIDLLSSDDDK